MADSTPKSYHTDPQLYLYTSLSSGSSAIVTATSRLQTILKANKIPFQALDVATDEKARMLWSRRAGKRKLPGLVRMGMILADLEQVEEWNEYGEVKENLNFSAPAASTSTPTVSAMSTPTKPPPTKASAPGETPTKPLTNSTETPTKVSLQSDPANELTNAMRQVGFEAAKKAGDAKTKARTELLEAAKARNPDLQKLDHSGPTGSPAPSGTIEAEDAKKPQSLDASVGNKADETPATSIEEPKALEAEEKAARTVDKAGYTKEKDGVPASKEVEETANTATIHDESEVAVLEGTGQAEPEVFTAKEAEEKAHNAMVEDEKEHVHIAGKNLKVNAERETESDKQSKEESLKDSDYPPDKVDEAPRTSETADANASQEQIETGRITAAATDEVQNLPGSKPQDQPAANAEKAGESVAD